MSTHDLAQLLRATTRMGLRNFAKTTGNVYFVIKSTETYYADFIEQFQTVWEDGSSSIQNTVAAAYALMVSGRHDVMVIDGNGTHALTEMLTISKSRCTFAGIDHFMGVKRSNGPSAKVSLGVTTAITDLGAIKNLGVRNSFHGIKFINDNTLAESIYGVLLGGEYGYYEACEFYKGQNLNANLSAEVVLNEDSPTFRNCTFGSLASERVGTVILPNILMTKATVGAGLVCRDVKIYDSEFWINASHVNNRFIYGANATDIERYMLVENSKFINNGASANVPAQNVAFGATLTVGDVLLNNCSSINAATAMSTTTGVFVDGPVPAAATTGISVQTS